jgi:hypothetical protein
VLKRKIIRIIFFFKNRCVSEFFFKKKNKNLSFSFSIYFFCQKKNFNGGFFFLAMKNEEAEFFVVGLTIFSPKVGTNKVIF